MQLRLATIWQQLAQACLASVTTRHSALSHPTTASPRLSVVPSQTAQSFQLCLDPISSTRTDSRVFLASPRIAWARLPLIHGLVSKGQDIMRRPLRTATIHSRPRPRAVRSRASTSSALAAFSTPYRTPFASVKAHSRHSRAPVATHSPLRRRTILMSALRPV